MSAVLDILLVLIMAGFTLGGMSRGLRRELLNLAGVIVAVAGGIILAKPVALLVARLGVIEEVPWLLAFLGGFVAASLVFSILKAPLLPRNVDLAERISGGLLGFGKGMVIAALTVYLLVGVWPRSADAVSEARAARLVMPVTRLVDAAAGVVGGLLPKDLSDRLRDGHRNLRGAIEGIEEAIGTLEDVGEHARAYSEKAMEGAAVADSLARVVIPPEEH